ncbi:calcium-independent phospholipase A2-gamma [Bombyx mori]|uniref:PNPLA domain-containing protein n=1 Tax=Bombyx mori TaxID=7091 RepID=A0A8R1WPV5_BOMMO|nr:calcium-independent phospholipase A2-gamma [Bombyx mori]
MKNMSFGGQWRVLRHYLSLTNLNAEAEKLIQKIKPVTPEQWERFLTKLEKALSVQVIEQNKSQEVINLKDIRVKATAIEETHKTEKSDERQAGGLGIGSEAKEITFESFLQGLKLKKDLHFGKLSEPSWKSNKPTVTKTSIHSRTAYVISAIVTAETSECLMKRTEHFIDHLTQYPEARDYAIKEGAVRALLRVENKLNDEIEIDKQVKGVVNEALALVGYTGPTKGPGPNILSLDGGGIRGLIAIEILKHLEKITGRKVHELFDYIIGVSTGAIIAAVIGSGIGSLETASQMYRTLSKEMFGKTSVIGGTSRLVWTHSYYDTEAWEKMLQENLRNCTLSECNRYNRPKIALVSCVVRPGAGLSPYVFRSYSCGFRVRAALPGSGRPALWQAVRASAAAPTYFHEFTLDGLIHQDGGIMVNNPTGVGIHEARLLYGADALRKGTIISVGTGKALNKHAENRGLSKGAPKDPAGTSWKEKFNKILESATDTEGVHLVVSELLPPGSYYRFNPPLMQECAMDEIDPEKLASLLTDTNDYIRRNQHKFERAAAMLTRKRGLVQRAADYVRHKRQIMGLVQGH